jgi:hypothetical protein
MAQREEPKRKEEQRQEEEVPAAKHKDDHGDGAAYGDGAQHVCSFSGFVGDRVASVPHGSSPLAVAAKRLVGVTSPGQIVS